MKLAVIGNSHMATLRNALREGVATNIPLAVLDKLEFGTFGNDNIERSRFHRLEGDWVVVEAEIGENRTFGRDPAVTYCFSYGTDHAFLCTDPILHADGGRTGTHVSQGLLHEMIVNNKRWALAFFDDLLSVGVSFFVMSAPPPRNEYRTPAPQVLRIHGLAQEYIRGELQSRGVDLVDPPPDTVDANGFLKARFRRVGTPDRPDRHHGNDLYGARMLERVVGHHFGNGGRRDTADGIALST